MVSIILHKVTVESELIEPHEAPWNEDNGKSYDVPPDYLSSPEYLCHWRCCSPSRNSRHAICPSRKDIGG